MINNINMEVYSGNKHIAQLNITTLFQNIFFSIKIVWGIEL